jgi:hypothetical protein
VRKFIKDDCVDPNFNFGLSEKTLLHVFKQYCGGDAAVPTVTSTITSPGHSAPEAAEGTASATPSDTVSAEDFFGENSAHKVRAHA